MCFNKRMRDPTVVKMVVLTLVSGIVSGVLITPLWFVGPGMFFAIATAIVFTSLRWFGIARSVIWAIASAGAWYLAVRVYATRSFGPGVHHSAMSNMVQAGLIGSLILAAVLSLLLRSVKLKPDCTNDRHGSSSGSWYDSHTQLWL